MYPQQFQKGACYYSPYPPDKDENPVTERLHVPESYTPLRGGLELDSGSLTLKPTFSTTKPQNHLSVYPYLERISKLKFKLSQEMKPLPHHSPSLFVIGFEDACALSRGPMHCSPPGSSVHGNSQARILEWVATSISRGSSQPRA